MNMSYLYVYLIALCKLRLISSCIYSYAQTAKYMYRLWNKMRYPQPVSKNAIVSENVDMDPM